MSKLRKSTKESEMSNGVSVLDFQTRCKLATDYLKANLEDYQATSLETPARIANLLAPKTSDSPIISQMKREMLQESTEMSRSFHERINQVAWRCCISLSEELHGEDATVFALKTIEFEGKKQAN